MCAFVAHNCNNYQTNHRLSLKIFQVAKGHCFLRIIKECIFCDFSRNLYRMKLKIEIISYNIDS